MNNEPERSDLKAKPAISLAETRERYVINIPGFQIELFHSQNFPHSKNTDHQFSLEVETVSDVPTQPLKFWSDWHTFTPDVPVSPCEQSDASSALITDTPVEPAATPFRPPSGFDSLLEEHFKISAELLGKSPCMFGDHPAYRIGDIIEIIQKMNATFNPTPSTA